MKKRTACFFCAIIFILVSCVSQKPSSRVQPVFVTDTARYALLPPAKIVTPLDMAQRITGSYGNQEFSFDAWVQADETRITIALFNDFGSGMGDLSFNADGISFSSPYFPASVRAEYIAADFQFCFYRADALESALKDAGLTFTAARDNEDKEIRTIFDGEKRVIVIEKTPAEVRYVNFLRGYQYTLKGDF